MNDGNEHTGNCHERNEEGDDGVHVAEYGHEVVPAVVVTHLASYHLDVLHTGGCRPHDVEGEADDQYTGDHDEGAAPGAHAPVLCGVADGDVVLYCDTHHVPDRQCAEHRADQSYSLGNNKQNFQCMSISS